MKKSVDSSKQSIDNTKKQIDSTYDEYKKFANDTKTEINNAKQAIINGKNEINTLAKEKVDEYTQKVTDFNNNYDTKTASLDTKINEIQTNANEIVENSTEQLKENIAESKNDAIKQIQSEGQSYQDQINELQKSEALQDEAINKLKNDIDLKVTQPYLNNKGEKHIVNSDNGLMRDLVIKGNTIQVTTKGYQLFYLPDDTKISNGVTTTIKDGLISCEGTVAVNGWFDVCGKLNISLKQGIEYTFSINKALSVRCALKTFEDAREIDRNITIGKTSMQFTPDSDISRAYVWIAAPAGTNIDIQFRVQVEKGSTAHDYEPYTGGQLSPNPDYPQEVKGVDKISGKIIGKNLFGGIDFANKIVELGGTLDKDNKQVSIYSSVIDNKTIFKTPETGKYTVIVKGKNTASTQAVNIYGFTTFNSNGYARNVYEDLSELKGRWNTGTAIYDYEYFGVFEGELTLDDFMKYTSTPISYTLQNPLYRLSDSVYDYIDIDRGKIIRNIGVITFDGSDDEGWCLSSTQYTNNIRFYTSILGDSTIHLNLLVLCNKFSYIKNMQGNDLMGISYTNTLDIQLDKSNLSTQDLTGFKAWLNKNPITVVYQLATPVEEPLPSDLQTLLQSLKTYYPQTNIMFDTEVEPYINFDYKLNLKSWIEDKDNKEIIYDKQNKEKDKYSSTFFENMFALQRTGKVYTVKFPKWETSHISTGEKLDANAGLICEPSTKTIKGQNDYANIPLFKTYDVNAYVDDEGVRHVTAIKGDKDFKDEGKVDVFVLGMSYYEKVWEDDQYWYYSRTDSPRDGYTIARECINRDGSIQPFALYAKYVAGNIDGNLYSSKGLKPARYYGTTPLPANTTNTDTSHNGLVSQCHKRGSFYSSGVTCDYKYILTTFYLKYGTLNTQSIMGGCNNYSAQYEASIKSSTNNTYFPLTKAQADYFPVGASVSIGYKYGGSSLDRYYSTVSIYADNVKIIKKVALDDSNTALYLDTNTPFNTANTSSGAVFCSAMHWRSGFSDDILGRDGCPCETKSELTNGKFPIVIQGIECMVGGYETYGNAFMDIVDATGKREVYIQNDASQLTTDIATAKTTYKKSPYAIQPTKLNSWNYITRIDFDLENGAFVQTNVGQDGSSTTTGFADGVYVDNASSGQREFLGFGALWSGSFAGLSCLYANNGVGYAYWFILARLSINGVGGELTA